MVNFNALMVSKKKTSEHRESSIKIVVVSIGRCIDDSFGVISPVFDDFPVFDHLFSGRIEAGGATTWSFSREWTF